MQFHPDKNPGNDTTDRFQRVGEPLELHSGFLSPLPIMNSGEAGGATGGATGGAG